MFRPNLSKGLRRCRAIALCLGERSYFVRPCDLSRGRPRSEVKAFLDKWRKPYRSTGEYDRAWHDAMLQTDPLCIIVSDCVDYLNKTGSCRGWFEIDERAQILGSPVTLRVRSYDFLVTAGSIFGPPNSCIFARDGSGELSRREFFPMIGPAPRQRMHARRIKEVSNFLRS